MKIADNDPIKKIAQQADNGPAKKQAKLPTEEAGHLLNQMGTIKTIGTVDSRHGMTRKKNVSIRETIYDYIEEHTLGNQNMTLILNDLLSRGIASIDAELVEGDVTILGN